MMQKAGERMREVMHCCPVVDYAITTVQWAVDRMNKYALLASSNLYKLAVQLRTPCKTFTTFPFSWTPTLIRSDVCGARLSVFLQWFVPVLLMFVLYRF